ncbi:DNA polymerase III subunit gamma/tau [Neisseria zalophi]|uniref:DNA polymerase III subunit gamma/tau n=1 Tax=Neisseria zalophi TaxID=640030 RepID=A0A5J6PVU6_9NEIS|nr:DNA polymerase III subunit gamma/tau [Neisseria zalophi]QEY26695.1 DNA polymerase III subunit gamma/tau [Neisseria zalophi]
MAYQVLARKWRPKTFADLVGQEHVVKALRNALDKGRLHHAYLLTGTRGVGKTTIARILAKSLNCENASHGEPCGVCQSCTQIDAGRYVDLLEIDAASNTGIDNIREVLENAQYAPTAGKYKVYIIDEVHMLSKSAFNAMLKTLEEPPEHVKFILATTDPHKVPITVLSRCLQFVLRNMTSQQVADHLAHVLTVENIPFEQPALQLLGRAAMGSMRDALSLLDQAIAMGSGSVTEQDIRQMIGAVDKHYLYELLQGIVNQDGEALLRTAQDMAARAIGFDSALSELAMLLQRLALIKTVPAALADDPERDALLRFAQYLGDEQIQLYYQCAIHGKQDLSLAPDEYAGFVMTLLRMLAFAPIAAKAHAPDGVIEGTQLHAPVYQQPATPMPVVSEAQPEEPHTAPHNQPIDGDEDDTPPWQDEPETAVADNHTLENIQTAESQPAPQSDNIEPVTPDNAVEATTAEPLLTEPSQPETQSVSEIVSHNTATPIQTASIQETRTPEPENNLIEADNEPPYIAETEPEPDNYSDADDSDEYAPQQPSEIPLPAALTNSEESEEPEDTEEHAFIPLPEFAPENWAGISKRLAPKLGAAQMLTQHAAWTRYDAENHLMILALTDEARATTNKDRLEKVRSTLADAYGITLKLQTEPWRDDAGWETPTMRHKRLQQEGRRQAQDLLEADPAAQQILSLFEAEWLPETLELTDSQE